MSHHFHPESWAPVREGQGQALTGARAGGATEHRKDLRPRERMRWLNSTGRLRLTCQIAALAHVVPNKVEAAYARSDLFERLLLLMDDWAKYLQDEGGPATPR